MTELLLIRHGETSWNKEKRYQGWRDIPLSDRGRAQARLVAEFLADKPLAAVYSSPLQRARETAWAIAQRHGLEVVVREALREINVGDWEGMTRAEIEKAWPKLWQQWQEDAYTAPPMPGGEGYREFQQRCIDVLEEIAAAHGDGGAVAVVCHGGVIRGVLAGLLGIPWRSRGVIYSHNCSITRLRWQQRGQVIIAGFNDFCHLGEDG